jgi:single-strand DNA-binding protein
MANLNKVMLIGRLTRDPETRTFANGGKVAKIGFAVAFIRQKKNPATGQWEGGETAFVDVEAFNAPREGGRQLADLVEQYLRKGNQVYIEGRLRLDQWEKDGQKRQRLLVVADNIEFLEGRGDAGGEGYGRSSRVSSPPYAAPSQPASSQFDEAEADPVEPPPPGGSAGGGGSGEDLPF